MEFASGDDIRVVVKFKDGEPMVLVGVTGEKAISMPLTVFMQCAGTVDAECSKLNIAIAEAEEATLH